MNIKHFFIFAATLLSFQCQKQANSEERTDFTPYISGFTTGMISSHSSIKIKLREKVPESIMENPLNPDILMISPKVSGTIQWTNHQTLEFIPEIPLSSGQTYTATLDLGALEWLNIQEDFNFKFHTIPQGIFIQNKGMQPYTNNDLSLQQYHVKVQTADIVNFTHLESSFTATQNGEKRPIRWEKMGEQKLFNLTIDSIQRGTEPSRVILSWTGEKIQMKNNGKEIIEIPSINDFTLLGTSVYQQPNQYLTLHMSDPLLENQNLEGLIHFQPSEKIRIDLEGNDIHIYPEKRLVGEKTIVVEKAVKNTVGRSLSNKIEKTESFTSIKPALELVSSGVILPKTGNLTFPFKAVNLNGINLRIIKIYEENIPQFFQTNQFDGYNELSRVGRIVYKDKIQLSSQKPIDYGTWNTFSIDLSRLIEVEPGAIYRIHLSFEPSQSLYPCDSVFGNTEDIVFNTEDEISDSEAALFDNPNTYYWDDFDIDYDYGNYNWRDRDNPCTPSYYMSSGRSIAQNILASDLGIIAKKDASNNLKLAVTNLQTTDPQGGVKINIFNFQNQLINSVNTDSKGFAEIPLPNKPFFLLAEQGNQKGYLRLDDGSSLSMSMFDVSGKETQKGMKGFLYGDRGVWRPGDSLYLTFVLEKSNTQIPESHPVIFELLTPDRQLYTREVLTTSLNGFYDFRTGTTTSDPTGNWLARIKVGGSEFTQTIKIETVKPNRLKINIDFGADIISKGSIQKGQLYSQWLHGAKAGNLKTDIELSIRSGDTKFEKYPDYNFDDPSIEFSTEDKIIFEGQTDQNGNVIFDPSIEISENVPGMLRANYKIRVFEKSGDFSVDNHPIYYSPYNSYVGIKIPKGNGYNGALYSNETNLIPIVSLDENGNPVNRNRIKIEIFDIKWQWWWERAENDDLSRYISNKSANLIKTDYVNTLNGKALYELNFNKDLYGRKLIRITDPVSGHSTGQTFYVTYKGWWDNSGDRPEGAEMLTFSSNKEKYNVGENIEISLPEFQMGRALVSIETGSEIIDQFWVTPNENNSFDFDATPEMAPNIFVNVSLIQPHENTKNDLPIRMYGVQSIEIEDPNTHLNPQLSMPDELEPEKPVTIEISEANNKAMTYTIAVVDEGLLDLTGFSTPAPWSYFYSKEALGIKTWDMYKYVIGAFSGEMAGLLALGGDEFIKPNDANKVNRFKPVVKFLGPYSLEKGEKKSHTFTMPNYVGSVRTMVVAGENQAYGSVEKTTPVKKPLMVLATLPRVLGPSEQVKLPVTVFAMDPNIKNVTIRVEPNKLLENNGPTTKTVKFNETGEKVINFDLDVTEAIGIGKVKISATSGGQSATDEIELAVRAPSAEISHVEEGVITPETTYSTEYSSLGLPGTNQGVVEISSIPPLNLEQRMQYLIRYPHGCLEQITSSVFPQLYLPGILELTNTQQEEIQNNITAGIDILKGFQIGNGSFSYWPGAYSETSEWGTNYIGHFLLEAKSKGYSIPQNGMEKWLRYQKLSANTWAPSQSRNSGYYNGELVQAYRLYTLALAGQPEMGAMNRLKELSRISIAAQWRLAGAYFLAGKEETALNIVDNISTDVKQYHELGHTFGSDLRDHAMILEVLSLLNDKVRGKKIFDQVAEELASQRWLSTQSTAYSLLAISKFIDGDQGSGTEFQITINGKSKDISSTKPIYQEHLDFISNSNGNISVRNNGSKDLFIRVQTSGIPLRDDVGAQTSDLHLSTRYLTLNGEEITEEAIDQGTDFICEVTVSNPGLRGTYEELALTQIFPSGWEIRNTRMDIQSPNFISDSPEYEDIRDDRVYKYFDLKPNGSKTFSTILNASYLGTFYLPGIYCEAMYDRSIHAKSPGKWVKVVQPGIE
ncbi:alpha-2-macroglobulin family protein [Membranihabitans maritimus]|uniref:alpha-2-macroglobulin family protein n=1 Tax=Membranihabitans maritimus TaxID=2904244 RepID=UPI001EFFF1E9|nr:MG2 domain-containing protein [Membranihabitans maritimus]